MNLQSEIGPELWKAIARSYVSEAYSNAIIEAFRYMTDILREKSDLDGDGVSLVGQALSGEIPKIRINSLQTQSEKDEQKGYETIIRGLYIGIRNPRAHDSHHDEKPTTDAIVFLIDHICNIIDQSKGPFVLENWANRIFDPDFYLSDRYIQLITDEVPPRRRIEALIYLYSRRSPDSSTILRAIFSKMIGQIEESRISEFTDVVSEDLKRITEDSDVIQIITMLPNYIWPKITELARLRIENKMLRSLESGKTGWMRIDEDFYDEPVEYVTGELGTYISNIIDHFTLKFELYAKVSRKMSAGGDDLEYVSAFFLEHLPRILIEFPFERPRGKVPGRVAPMEHIINRICEKYNHYCNSTKLRMHNAVSSLPRDWQEYIIKQQPELDDLPF